MIVSAMVHNLAVSNTIIQILSVSKNNYVVPPINI